MLQIGAVTYDRQAIADHATNLATTIQGNLKRSLEAIGVVRKLPLHIGLPTLQQAAGTDLGSTRWLLNRARCRD